MHIAIEWRGGLDHPCPATQLFEVVTPRANDATITPMENLLASLSLPDRFALEIAAESDRQRFLVRTVSESMGGHLEDQFGAAYPQAVLRSVPRGEAGVLVDNDDPAQCGPGERVTACTLVLRDPLYLPLRPFRDADIDDERSAQADPILGILGALGRLPAGWRALCQLVVAPAPENWARPYRRLALERPLAADHAPTGTGPGGSTTNAQLYLLALAALALALWYAHQWYEAGDWARLGLLTATVACGVPAPLWLARRLSTRLVYDPRLVREKIARPARIVELRLAVITPGDVPVAAARARLDQLATAYRQFTHDEGNGFVPRPLKGAGIDPRTLAPLSSRRRLPILNTRELATLWHLPQAGADVAFVERTTARRLLPPPRAVACGCPIGVSARQGHRATVAIPDDTIRRHLLLIAKTRRGKSSLLLTIVRDLQDRPPAAGPAPGLVLIDPHRDLARAALGLVPPARHDDVVYLNLDDSERPFGLNLLDVGLGWERDVAIASALKVFRQQFDQFWGPRMEDCFRWGLLTLFEANEAYCATDPTRGRDRQHTVLEVPQLFVNLPFRRQLLGLVRDPGIVAWWEDFFDSALDRRLRVESTNPVVTKINRFTGSRAARALVGQPRSTIDPVEWVREGRLVIVNGAKGQIGETTCALIGGTLLNLVDLAIGAQSALDPVDRRPVRIIVDEFHAFPGADYESLLSEQAKFGASLTLATQSLERLDEIAPGRGLRSTVFANLDGLFAFHCSAEDAEYLLPELGAPLTVEDLTALGEHRCYVRLSSGGERLPAFLVELHPPPASDLILAGALGRASAARYGRPRELVEATYAAMLARLADLRKSGEGLGGGTKKNGKGLRHDPPRRQPEATGPDAEERPSQGNERERPARPSAIVQPGLLFGPPLDETATPGAAADEEVDNDDEENDHDDDNPTQVA